MGLDVESEAVEVSKKKAGSRRAGNVIVISATIDLSEMLIDKFLVRALYH